MKDLQVMQGLGLLIGVPLLIFAKLNNAWAEPLPPEAGIIPTVTVEVEQTAELIELEEAGEQMDWRDDLDLLAACVEAEAGNQSVLGKRLVADVILNRVEHPLYPNSIREVIYQPGQFTVTENGALDRAIPSAETWRAVITEVEGIRIDENILYFRTGGYGYGEPWERVGDHYFSTGKELE